MEFNDEETVVEMSFQEAKQLSWFPDLVDMQIDQSMEELEEIQPEFKFRKNYEDEIKDGRNTSHHDSAGWINIGESGVAEDWEGFLEELERIENRGK